MITKLKPTVVLLAFALFTSGCAHYPVNVTLSSVGARTEYRFQNKASPTNSDEVLFVLAFSGGGIRAASLAYGVLEELNRNYVGQPGNQHRLLSEVDVISAVSGGSFTAAFYALWGDRIFSDFEPRFLNKHNQNALLLRSLAPWNLMRLASPTFSNNDLAAEYYDRWLFDGATFGDLATKPGRPFLLVNASDIALGERFAFTKNQFDLIASDLSQFPLARSVAASSAFPVLLSPIVLHNYSQAGQRPEPEWIQAALSNPQASTRRKKRALEARSYMDGSSRRFVHLLDGGITDNLGLRGLTDGIVERGSADSVLREFRLEKVRKIAVIVVNAQADVNYDWDSRQRSPRFNKLVGSVSRVALSRYSFETIELFKECALRLAQEMESNGREPEAKSPTAPSGAFKTAVSNLYFMELHFNRLANESDRRFFNAVPTGLQLPAKTVQRLRHLAASQLANNEEFKRLVRDLKEPPMAR
jgi:NTE family protein